METFYPFIRNVVNWFIKMIIGLVFPEIDWKSRISDLQNEIIRQTATDGPFVLECLALNTSKYLLWWAAEFQNETKCNEAALIGWQLAGVLTSALELAKLYHKKGNHQAVPSPGEYAEIVDDLRRYVHMMNRLIHKQIICSEDNPASKFKTQILKQLHDSIEQDSSLLQTAIVCFPPADSPVAVKISHYEGGSWSPTEIDVPAKLQALDSSHILKLLGLSEDNNMNMLLILELMQKNIIQLIHSSSPIPLSQFTDIIIQIAKGMRHLHRNNVIHRDLKPRNVLVKSRNNQNYLVKIADFGECKSNFGTRNSNTLNLGTNKYMAPEMKGNNVDGYYARNVDVYSFGITCSDLYNKMEVSNSLRQLIQRSSHQEASGRPSFEEICEELWVIMEELLTKTPTASIKRSIYPLIIYQAEADQEYMIRDLRLEGEPVVDKTLKVHFTLNGDYCIVTWLRRYSDRKVSTIKNDTCEGPAKRIVHEYKITLDDVDTVITIKCSVRNSFHCVDAPAPCRIQKIN